MVNLWSLVAFIVFILHFFSRGIFETADSMISILYPAILTIYATQKEYMRWKSPSYHPHFLGEFYVVIWTAVFIAFVLISTFTRGYYKVTLEMVTTYLAVLSIYAITKKSKELRAKK